MLRKIKAGDRYLNNDGNEITIVAVLPSEFHTEFPIIGVRKLGQPITFTKKGKFRSGHGAQSVHDLVLGIQFKRGDLVQSEVSTVIVTETKLPTDDEFTGTLIVTSSPLMPVGHHSSSWVANNFKLTKLEVVKEDDD